jgi:hypothetical protein
MTNSSKSTKLRTKKQAAADEPEQLVDIIAAIAPADDAPLPDDWAAEIIRRVLAWQIEQIKMKPSKNTGAATVRARDARTMTELVRNLDRLDAVNKRREGKGRKSKSRNDKDIREEFIRRLDQLLAARDADGAAAKPQRG